MDALRTEQSANTAQFVSRLLIIAVLGYWAFGKAFAYIGLYPLYIGEALLVAGLAVPDSPGDDPGAGTSPCSGCMAGS